jgi:hypothetical protein
VCVCERTRRTASSSSGSQSCARQSGIEGQPPVSEYATEHDNLERLHFCIDPSSNELDNGALLHYQDPENFMAVVFEHVTGSIVLPKLCKRADVDWSTVTTASVFTMTTGDTVRCVIGDDPNNANLQELRVYVNGTQRLTSTGIDDDWSAGPAGLYVAAGASSAITFDNFKVGLDNNSDDDIADAGDDILVSDDFGSNVISLSYDNNGNLTNDGVYKFEYDAWNRLRKTILTDGSDETTIGEYEYYADNRRSKKTVSSRGAEVVENDGGNTTVLFYYDNQWRILETRNGSNQTTFQHLWGTQYTDELIWLEKNGDPTESNDTNPDSQGSESTADTRYFVHQDRNWNVVALSQYDTAGTNNGRIVERYSYTPYGSFVVLNGESGNGELDSVSLTSTVGNVFAHQGLAFDQAKASYQNRHREYPARLQRFAQRDPLWNACGGTLSLSALAPDANISTRTPRDLSLGSLAVTTTVAVGCVENVNLYCCYLGNPLFQRDLLGLASRPWPDVPPDRPCPLGWRDCGSVHCMCFITSRCCTKGTGQACCAPLTGYPFCCVVNGRASCCNLFGREAPWRSRPRVR